MSLPSAAPDAVREQRLAELLDLMTGREQRGEPSGVEQFVREYPDLAEELRRLWAAVQVAGAFGRPAAKKSLHSAPTELEPSRPPPDSSEPPRRFGDYELLEEVGHGGMGKVYR